jgi:hypothetical protein
MRVDVLVTNFKKITLQDERRAGALRGFWRSFIQVRFATHSRLNRRV